MKKNVSLLICTTIQRACVFLSHLKKIQQKLKVFMEIHQTLKKPCKGLDKTLKVCYNRITETVIV